MCSGCSNGLYYASSDYMWLISYLNQQDTNLNFWSWIWKLHVPESMCFIAWFIVHNSLPTNSLRMLLQLSIIASCNRCNHLYETTFHTLRDCPILRTLWSTNLFLNSANFLFTYLYVWFRQHASGLTWSLLSSLVWNLKS